MRNTLLAQAFFASKRSANPTNVYETDSKYLIEIELPYFTEKDINITKVPEGIRVKGQKVVVLPEPFETKHTINRLIDRHIQLKETFEADAIEASLLNGILQIEIEKKPVQTIPISIR